MSMTTVNGGTLRCSGSADVTVECQGQRVTLAALVVTDRPLGVDLVLGMSGIVALGGVSMRTPADVSFRVAAAVTRQGLTVDAPDFTAEFTPDSGVWTIGWKWAGGARPECLQNTVPEYKVPAALRPAYEAELDEWVASGWLQPYDEASDGPPRGLLPLMAVEQTNKVRPVLDYRELNSHVTAHTADADVCADQLRKWRRHGSRVAVVDLRKAYLQLHLERRLWPYQTVMVRGRRHALRRLGYGLNIGPVVMKGVIRAVLEQDERMQRGVLPFVDDLLVNEDIVSADDVVRHFAQYGLQCKPPQRAADGARLLGLRVGSCGGELQWQRDTELPAPPVKVTRRSLFAWCGRLVAHLPVAGWLRPAAAWLKRRVNSLTKGWDDATDDPMLQAQIRHVVQRLQEADPARGPWRLTGDRLVVWTDASSIANGVVLEDPGRGTVEDGSWLRAENKATMHINMAELDAALSGINMAVAWGVKVIDLRTDSATVHRWIADALTGRARLRTKAHGELLIRRRVEIIKQLVEELQLSVTIGLVRSADNPADALTRVPKTWLPAAAEEPAQRVVAAGDRVSRGGPVRDGSDTDRARTRRIHETTGHQGIKRTLWYVRRELGPAASRSMVREVIQECDTCQSIDPAPVRWQTGSLGVQQTWERLAMDVVKYRDRSFLSLIDCGPSRYCIWKPLHRSTASEIGRQLEEVFLERGAPAELLTDNAREFRGQVVADLMARWGVHLRFRAAHEPSGNAIVERNHRTIKVMAARQNITVAEAVHRYNLTPRDGLSATTAPAAGVLIRPGRDLPVPDGLSVGPPPAANDRKRTTFTAGDPVWVRCRGGPTRCTDVSRRGVVTRVVSSQQVEVDGTPWHVRSVRHRCGAAPPVASTSGVDNDDDCYDGVPLVVSSAPTPDGVPLSVSPAPPSDSHSDTTATGDGANGLDNSDIPGGERENGPARRSERARRPPEELYGSSVPEGILDEILE